jgi:hypothetical protein
MGSWLSCILFTDAIVFKLFQLHFVQKDEQNLEDLKKKITVVTGR